MGIRQAAFFSRISLGAIAYDLLVFRSSVFRNEIIRVADFQWIGRIFHEDRRDSSRPPGDRASGWIAGALVDDDSAASYRAGDAAG